MNKSSWFILLLIIIFSIFLSGCFSDEASHTPTPFLLDTVQLSLNNWTITSTVSIEGKAWASHGMNRKYSSLQNESTLSIEILTFNNYIYATSYWNGEYRDANENNWIIENISGYEYCFYTIGDEKLMCCKNDDVVFEIQSNYFEKTSLLNLTSIQFRKISDVKQQTEKDEFNTLIMIAIFLIIVLLIITATIVLIIRKKGKR